MNNYTKYTKTLSNLKLFEMLENKADYKEKSIHAVQMEWDSRAIEPAELEQIQAAYNAQIAQKERFKVLRFWRNKEEYPKIIQGIAALMIGYACFIVFNQMELIQYFLKHLGEFEDDFMRRQFIFSIYSMIAYFIAAGLGAYYLTQEKNLGWILSIIILVFWCSGIVKEVIWDFNYLSSYESIKRLSYNPVILILSLLVLSYLNKSFVLDIYKIDKNTQLITLILSITMALIIEPLEQMLFWQLGLY